MKTIKKTTIFILIISMVFLTGCALFGGEDKNSNTNSNEKTYEDSDVGLGNNDDNDHRRDRNDDNNEDKEDSGVIIGQEVENNELGNSNDNIDIPEDADTADATWSDDQGNEGFEVEAGTEIAVDDKGEVVLN